ncbi:MAG: MarR family transcriptional regulator [Flavobacteriales bacterium]|nr:MarR family transcriptional regulator [Flavobacteriales bacterium]
MGIKEAIKQNKFDSNQLMATVNIIYTANWLRDQNAPVYKTHGILSQHYNILRIVRGSHPKPVTPGYIKEVMLDKGRDLTRLVDKLVKLNYLERRLCEHNRRKMEITITKTGLDLIDVISKDSEPLFKAQPLTEEESLQLSNLLDKLRG